MWYIKLCNSDKTFLDGDLRKHFGMSTSLRIHTSVNCQYLTQYILKLICSLKGWLQASLRTSRFRNTVKFTTSNSLEKEKAEKLAIVTQRFWQNNANSPNGTAQFKYDPCHTRATQQICWVTH